MEDTGILSKDSNVVSPVGNTSVLNTGVAPWVRTNGITICELDSITSSILRPHVLPISDKGKQKVSELSMRRHLLMVLTHVCGSVDSRWCILGIR